MMDGFPRRLEAGAVYPAGDAKAPLSDRWNRNPGSILRNLTNSFFSVRNGLSKTTIAERTVPGAGAPRQRFLHSRTPSAAPASAPANEAPAARPAPILSAPTQFRSFGGTLFAKSLYRGGAFANDVIGTVAKGDYRTTGSITGETATRL